MNPDDERSNVNRGELSTGFVDQPVTQTGGHRAVNWRKPGFLTAGGLVVALLVAAGYLLKVTQPERQDTAAGGTPITPSATSLLDSSTEDRHYIQLSQNADYVIYGRVLTNLGQTAHTEEIRTSTDKSFSTTKYYNHFLIDVIRSVTAQGVKSEQPSPTGRITIRQWSTSNSPKFTIGESFIAFIRYDTVTGTYYVTGLTAGPVQGKLPVMIKDGLPLPLVRGLHNGPTYTVDHFLQLTARPE